MGAGHRYGAQGRHRELFRRMRDRNQGSTRHQPFALFGTDLKGDVPSHAGNRAPSLWPDRGKESPLHRLHYRRSAALAIAAGAPSHAEPQRRHQDRHHSGTLIPATRTTTEARDITKEASFETFW